MPSRDSQLPRISLVVPSYNQARFLPKALDSIFSQQYPHLEVVVMDGGSTDGSVAVIESYAPRLKYWQSRPDGGQSRAINAGMRHCTGDLVAWLNSDDFYWADALWVVARAYADYPGRGLYVGNGFRYAERTGRLFPFCDRHVGFDREALRRGTDFVLQPSTFMLRQAWEAVGGLDSGLNYCMDWDVFLRIAADRPAVLINEFVAVTREYEETKTRSGKMERAAEIIRMAGKHAREPLTPGGLLYLLETLLEVTSGWHLPGLREQLSEGFQTVARGLADLWGGGHSFPEGIGPCDRVYLPFAAPGVPEAPRAADDSRLPSISVVLPIDGPDAMAEATLRSVRAQAYPDVEAVVVDHGPADAPHAPAGFGGAERVTRLDDPGLSRAAAAGRGLRHGRGEILAWLASGEQLAHGALRAVGEVFAQDPETDVVYGNAVRFDGSNEFATAPVGPWRSGFCIGALPEPAGPDFTGKTFPAPRATIFFRRRVLETVVGPRENLSAECAEYDFLARLTSRRRVRKLERTQAMCPASPRRPLALVCGPRPPTRPGRSGGEEREYQLLCHLARFASVQFFSQYPAPPPTDAAARRPPMDVHCPERLQASHPDLVSLPDLRPRLRTRLASKLRHLHLPVPGPCNPLAVTRQFRRLRAFCVRAIEKALAEQSPDFLFVIPQTNPLALTLGADGRETRRILIAHAVEWQEKQALAGTRRGVFRLGLRWEAGRARAFERENLARFDGVVAACEHDRRLLVAAYGFPAERVFVAGKGVDVDYWGQTSRAPEPDLVVFYGDLHVPVNAQAVRRLVGRVFPLVLRSRPGARLRIVNSGPPAPLPAARSGGCIEVLHAPGDCRPLLAAGAVACLPLPPGGAVEGCVLEVVAAGAPLACSPEALEGLDLQAGRHVLVGGDDRQLAAAVCRLLADGAAAQELARAGAAQAARRHDWHAAAGLRDWLTELKQLPRRAAPEAGFLCTGRETAGWRRGA
jgi:glycosyltransferase involved in cell wall biosynthesis